MADALKEQNLLDKDAQFSSVDHLLDGLERTSSRLAATINTPPLDVAGLRREWAAIRDEARPFSRPPSVARYDRRHVGRAEKRIGQAEPIGLRDILDDGCIGSSGVSRARAVVLRVGASRGRANRRDRCDRTSRPLQETLAEIRETGYAAFAARQFRPYVRAAVDQFSPKKSTLTERLLGKLRMFKVLQIDHVELFVPDRYRPRGGTARLGLQIVPDRTVGGRGGPLMISSDGGSTKLALFEGQPATRLTRRRFGAWRSA